MVFVPVCGTIDSLNTVPGAPGVRRVAGAKPAPFSETSTCLTPLLSVAEPMTAKEAPAARLTTALAAGAVIEGAEGAAVSEDWENEDKSTIVTGAVTIWPSEDSLVGLLSVTVNVSFTSTVPVLTIS